MCGFCFVVIHHPVCVVIIISCIRALHVHYVIYSYWWNYLWSFSMLHYTLFYQADNIFSGPPSFEGEPFTSLEANVASISVNFTSKPPIQSVTWYNDKLSLSTDHKYDISTQVINLLSF